MGRGVRTHGGEIDVETTARSALYSGAGDEKERKRREEVKRHVDRKAGKTLAEQAVRDAGGDWERDREAAKPILAEWLDILGLNGRPVRLNDDHLTKFKGSKFADDHPQ